MRLTETVTVSLVFVLLGAVCPVNNEFHSLMYSYTAFSKPVSVPGIHQFTAEGQLDGRSIDYFDSDTAEKVPKQPWMKKNLNESYWTRGTDTRKSKQQWFDVNIRILRERMRQNDSDLHSLQWIHGCEAKVQDDGQLSLHRALDMYSYDGESFLSFDDVHGAWYSSNIAAKETIRKWDSVVSLKVYTKGYLESECLKWMKDFMGYRQKQLDVAPPPEVVMFATRSHIASNVRLSCLATGFYFKDVTLQMRRNGTIITKVNGLESSRVRPNHDDTYQRKDFVEIFKSDESDYTCEVIHKPTSLHLKKVWDHTLPPESGNITIIVAVIIIFIILVTVPFVLLLLYKKKKNEFPCKRQTDSDEGSDVSLSSSRSTDSNQKAESDEKKHLMDSQMKADKNTHLMGSQTKGSGSSLDSVDSGVSVRIESDGENINGRGQKSSPDAGGREQSLDC